VSRARSLLHAISSLDRKVLRDVYALRTQLIAIALVIACGVGLFLGMRATMRSLDAARSRYYTQERFAHIFARLERAPEVIAERLRRIPGVVRLQTRIIADVTLDVAGMSEAVAGRLVSIPDEGQILVNDVLLRTGRLPDLAHSDEVVVNEAFAVANQLRLGDRVAAVINGRRERFRIVGTGLSPEFTYAVAPGLIFPDDRRFGILWIRRHALAPAFDMQGAFNDVVFQISRDALPSEVIDRVDRVLDPYGGIGAIQQKDQQSAFFIENELAQLRSFGLMIPVTFLFVAGLLLNIVIGRIVASQRAQIASLKALGYHDFEVGTHYAKLVAVVVALGLGLGIVLASWLGESMIHEYSRFFRFPELDFELGARDLSQALVITLIAAALGAWAAIWQSVRLPPAEGMRPASPDVYRPTLIERLGWTRHAPPKLQMVLREIERRPWRAALSVFGISLAAALLVLTTFSLNAFTHMINVQFGIAQREDVGLTLFAPRAIGGLSELEHLPGVVHAEPYRSVAVRLRSGPRFKSVGVSGILRGTTLQVVLDRDLREVGIPSDGLVLSRKLAAILGVRSGDRVRLEVLEGKRREVSVPVTRVVETYVGLQAYMDLDALSRVLGETPSMTGAWLLVDDRELPALHARVKQLPNVAGVITRSDVILAFRKILDENLGTSLAFSIGFALVMALGVLYNAARITLAERARDLASLRVLGFRRSEVSFMLLGEIAILAACGIPLGLFLGRSLAALLVQSPGFDSEQLRIPLVIEPATYVMSALIIVGATCIAGFAAWRRLERIDIVEVLKTRD